MPKKIPTPFHNELNYELKYWIEQWIELLKRTIKHERYYRCRSYARKKKQSKTRSITDIDISLMVEKGKRCGMSCYSLM